jgi:opacity protein-like surface antigen
MKIMKFCFATLSLLLALSTNAQKSGNNSNKESGLSKFSLSFGLGIASYEGDLIEKSRLFNKPGYAYSAGLLYDFTKHISAKLNFGAQKIQAADSDNKSAKYKARNLSFAAQLVDMSIGAEYTVFDLNKHKLSPFVSAGVGAVFFTPYAYDITGQKQYLRELRTEGQARAYDRDAWEFPVGVGLKYKISEVTTLKLEFNYRFTSTDYLDDVSSNHYPSKATVDAINPATAAFTWRGNEVGGPAYPTNLTLPRGNPKDNDGFYTTEIKFVFKF